MRAAYDDNQDTVQVVHVNDLAAVESSAYLLKFDSVHGIWPHEVDVVDGAIVITHSKTGEKSTVTYSQASSPGDIAFANINATMVLEGTGVHLNRATLQPYFDNGIKKIVVSAPVKDADPVLNIVYGVNHDLYDASKDHIVTAASCTTNCLASFL